MLVYPVFFKVAVSSADYFCKHLIGGYSQDVDIEELNREMEMTNGKRR